MFMQHKKSHTACGGQPVHAAIMRLLIRRVLVLLPQVPDYEDRLSKFERMCVVKTFREDRTLVAAADYISDALGQRFVESVPLSMEKAWQESHKKCPLICLLSPGEGCCWTCCIRWLNNVRFSIHPGLLGCQS